MTDQRRSRLTMQGEYRSPQGIAIPRVPVRKLDLTLPPATVHTISAADLMLAAARMQRDGMSREAIMKRMDIGTHTGVTLDGMDRFLAQARAYLEQEIAAGRQPAESMVEVPVIYDDEYDDDTGDPE